MATAPTTTLVVALTKSHCVSSKNANEHFKCAPSWCNDIVHVGLGCGWYEGHTFQRFAWLIMDCTMSNKVQIFPPKILLCYGVIGGVHWGRIQSKYFNTFSCLFLHFIFYFFELFKGFIFEINSIHITIPTMIISECDEVHAAHFPMCEAWIHQGHSCSTHNHHGVGWQYMSGLWICPSWGAQHSSHEPISIQQ